MEEEIDNLINSEVNNEVNLPETWANHDVEAILLKLYEFDKTVCGFPDDYRKRKFLWGNMTKKQKKKVLDGWQKMHLSYQQQVLVDLSQDDEEAETAYINWNIHDTARLIHLFADPTGNKLFSDYFQVYIFFNFYLN